jgi:translin
VDLSGLSDEFHRRFDEVMAAREIGLSASRRAIRSSANAIRAIHRGEMDDASRLMSEAEEAVREADQALSAHPEIRHAGFLADAEKEYVEARLTAAIVTGAEFPGPDDLKVGLAPYLNGMAEAVGEGRRAILDLLRRGEAEEGERLLGAMEDVYHVLVSMDYPDAITGNLRRITDVARSILEKTRGDLTTSLVQKDLRDALEKHRDG